MGGADGRVHRLVGELVTGRVGVLARRRGGVLEAHRDVHPAVTDGLGGVERGHLERLDGDVAGGVLGLDLGPPSGDRVRDDRGERARVRADREPGLARGAQLGELGVGGVEAARERVGVAEQQLPGLGQGEPARAAVEQRRADLALERGDLLGDRGLRQGEGLGRARERGAPGDLAEGEQAPRLKHKLRLSTS